MARAGPGLRAVLLCVEPETLCTGCGWMVSDFNSFLACSSPACLRLVVAMAPEGPMLGLDGVALHTCVEVRVSIRAIACYSWGTLQASRLALGTTTASLPPQPPELQDASKPDSPAPQPNSPAPHPDALRHSGLLSLQTAAQRMPSCRLHLQAAAWCIQVTAPQVLSVPRSQQGGRGACVRQPGLTGRQMLIGLLCCGLLQQGVHCSQSERNGDYRPSADWGGSRHDPLTARTISPLDKLAIINPRAARLRGSGLHEQPTEHQGVGVGEVVVMPNAMSTQLCDNVLDKADSLYREPGFEKLKELATQPDGLRRLHRLGANGALYRQAMQETVMPLASLGIHGVPIYKPTLLMCKAGAEQGIFHRDTREHTLSITFACQNKTMLFGDDGRIIHQPRRSGTVFDGSHCHASSQLGKKSQPVVFLHLYAGHAITARELLSTYQCLLVLGESSTPPPPKQAEVEVLAPLPASADRRVSVHDAHSVSQHNASRLPRLSVSKSKGTQAGGKRTAAQSEEITTEELLTPEYSCESTKAVLVAAVQALKAWKGERKIADISTDTWEGAWSSDSVCDTLTLLAPHLDLGVHRVEKGTLRAIGTGLTRRIWDVGTVVEACTLLNGGNGISNIRRHAATLTRVLARLGAHNNIGAANETMTWIVAAAADIEA